MELYKKIETAYSHTTTAEAICFISNTITRYIREMIARDDDYDIYTVASLIKANELLLEKTKLQKLDTYTKEHVNAAITSIGKAKNEAERIEECQSE